MKKRYTESRFYVLSNFKKSLGKVRKMMVDALTEKKNWLSNTQNISLFPKKTYWNLYDFTLPTFISRFQRHGYPQTLQQKLPSIVFLFPLSLSHFNQRDCHWRIEHQITRFVSKKPLHCNQNISTHLIFQNNSHSMYILTNATNFYCQAHYTNKKNIPKSHLHRLR